MIKEIPSQYKKILSEFVLNIAHEVKRLRPIILELGEQIEMENDNFIITVKLKKKRRGM